MITKIKIRKTDYFVDTAKNKLTWEFINSNLWEVETFNVLDYFIKLDQCIIDMGCWSGVISRATKEPRSPQEPRPHSALTAAISGVRSSSRVILLETDGDVIGTPRVSVVTSY